MNSKQKIYDLWKALYPQQPTDLLDNFMSDLKPFDGSLTQDPLWYKDIVVYSLYVDLFAKDFHGLSARLDYLQELGVSCLWLLPILDSPMRDAGFDIRHYDRIRHDLLGLDTDFTQEQQETVFGSFLQEAHQRGIRVIFDIAINHCSEEHPWFVEARKSEDNPYRDYFIWTKDPELYKDARIIFKGMEDSNWEKEGDSWFFHRFFNFQPDLNYRNPAVLLEMTRNLLYWQQLGVDGFRADAIPYLWKEDGTDSENLPQTHWIVKFFRAVLDYVKPGTLLLAEACQKPAAVVEYLGDGDECHAAYHFPVMPMFYKAIAMQSSQPIRHILSPQVTPEIPANSQWFTFLRCHDELSLELVYVSEEDRKYIHEQYCHEPEWDFRMGEGISARLANLFQFDERRIGLAYSMIFSLPATPVIYYGDEFGKENDTQYYQQMKTFVGKDDTRFLVRGPVNWELRMKQLADSTTFQANVWSRLHQMLQQRKQYAVFGRGAIRFVDAYSKEEKNDHILAYERVLENERMLIVQNLSDSKQLIQINAVEKMATDILTAQPYSLRSLPMEPYAYHWFKIT